MSTPTSRSPIGAADEEPERKATAPVAMERRGATNMVSLDDGGGGKALYRVVKRTGQAEG